MRPLHRKNRQRLREDLSTGLLQGSRHINQDRQMLVRNGHRVPRDIEALFPGNPDPLLPKKAADMLVSHLINGFETALEQGMRPADALAVIMCWVSSEMVRIGSEKAGSS